MGKGWWRTIPFAQYHQMSSIIAAKAGLNGCDVPLLTGWNEFDGSSLRYPTDEITSNTHPDVVSPYAVNETANEQTLEHYLGLAKKSVEGLIEQGIPD